MAALLGKIGYVRHLFATLTRLVNVPAERPCIGGNALPEQIIVNPLAGPQAKLRHGAFKHRQMAGAAQYAGHQKSGSSP
ncbi:MAG: hypothetical protein AAFY43_01705 [Pseudomonadota bacterium]